MKNWEACFAKMVAVISLMLYPCLHDFAVLPIKRWNLFLLPLNLGQLYDFVWTRKCGEVCSVTSETGPQEAVWLPLQPWNVWNIVPCTQTHPAPWEISWREKSRCPRRSTIFTEALIVSEVFWDQSTPSWPSSDYKGWVSWALAEYTPTPRPNYYSIGLGGNKQCCFKSLNVGDDLFTDNWHNIVVMHTTSKGSVFLAKY